MFHALKPVELFSQFVNLNKMNDLVSIVIPCYNAEKFISETISSILSQDYTNFEIIIINDGGNDQSEEIIKGFQNKQINYYSQENKGVSFTRNKGLFSSKGKYIIFFDQDDLMAPSFISSRINILKNNDLNFVGGKVYHYIEGEIQKTAFTSPRQNSFFEDILLFNPSVITCPSNFMYKKEFLQANNLKFNEKLGSTADRYFLLECGNFSIGSFDNTIAPLYYRISNTSWSNTLTNALVKDNETYYKEIITNRIYLGNSLNQFKIKMLRILTGANYKTKNLKHFTFYGFQYCYRLFLSKITIK